MYGGKTQSDTAYCCPGEGTKERPESLTVEGVQIPLVDDLTFQKFTDLLNQEADTTVRVAALGRFFSGEKRTNGATSWGGAGHWGCCSLFVIERVESFEAHTRTDLDYTAEAGWYEKEGCKFRTLRDQSHVSVAYPDDTTGQAIAQQKRADDGDCGLGVQRPATSGSGVAEASLPRPGSGLTERQEDLCSTGVPVEERQESSRRRGHPALLAFVLCVLRLGCMGDHHDQRSRV